jgi:hypothetical protein
MMTEALLSASPQRRHSSLVTEGCEAHRKVPTSGSRTWSAGERMGRSVVYTLTGQTSTGGEGDPTASASPTDGTR